MFDLGWTEMLIIGVVALIVVGPKDLPKMFHTLGQAVGKLRGLASEFQSAMSAAAKEAGVDELQKDMRNLTSGKTFKDAAGLDALEKDLDIPGKPLHRPITPGPGTKKLESAKPAATPSSSPVEPDDRFDGFDEDSDAIAADYDADVAAREVAAREVAAKNEKLTQVEQLRLEKQARSDQARQEAARLRALREADEAAAADDPAPRPNAPPDASRTDRS